MFETAVLSYGPPTKRVWATFAGFTGQAVLIGCALLAPMVWPQVIPRVTWAIPIVGPPPPPPPPPPTGQVVPQHTKTITQFVDNVLRAPVKVPPVALQLTDEEPVVAATSDGVAGGMLNGQKGGVVGSTLLEGIISQARGPVLPQRPMVQEPPKGPPPPPPPPKTVRISQLQLATPIHKVDPVYPTLAKTAGISGTVELMGVLGVDGRIHELRVVRGHALLIQAAMDAVKQWVFAPTILNGQPVEVQAPIQVNFVLHR